MEPEEAPLFSWGSLRRHGNRKKFKVKKWKNSKITTGCIEMALTGSSGIHQFIGPIKEIKDTGMGGSNPSNGIEMGSKWDRNGIEMGLNRMRRASFNGIGSETVSCIGFNGQLIKLMTNVWNGNGAVVFMLGASIRAGLETQTKTKEGKGNKTPKRNSGSWESSSWIWNGSDWMKPRKHGENRDWENGRNGGAGSPTLRSRRRRRRRGRRKGRRRRRRRKSCCFWW